MQKTYCDWCEDEILSDSKLNLITENHQIKNEQIFKTDWGNMQMSQEFGGDSMNEPRLELCEDCATIRANMLRQLKENIHEYLKEFRKKNNAS